MSAGRVDVLAVLHSAGHAIGWLGSECKANNDLETAETYFKQADSIREARAAVAELIEALRQSDEWIKQAVIDGCPRPSVATLTRIRDVLTRIRGEQ